MRQAAYVFLAVVGVYSVHGQLCLDDKKDCVDSLQRFVGSLNFNYGTKEHELTTSCQKAQKYLDCALNASRKCDAIPNSFKEATHGTTEIIADLCTNISEWREIYLRRVRCFITLHNEIGRCEKAYAEEREKNPEDHCCGFNRFKLCTTNWTTIRCGREAGELMLKLRTSAAIKREKDCFATYSSCEEDAHTVAGISFETTTYDSVNIVNDDPRAHITKYDSRAQDVNNDTKYNAGVPITHFNLPLLLFTAFTAQFTNRMFSRDES